MKNVIQSLCLLALLALTFVSCRKHDDEPEKLNRRTVIVYMSAENNLTRNSDSDLNEMMDGSRSLSSDERLVVFVDNTSTKGPCIMEIANGKRDTVRTFESEFYACDPDRFREIIEWIENRYPAVDDNYALVLWGHATGWVMVNDTIAQSRQQRAYGQDNGNNSTQQSKLTRWMNITQMARALEGLPRFRYIFADCCLMMCAEVAYELRHTADYLIGSPAEIPAEGAPYHLLTKALFSEKDDFYRDIIDTYYNYYTEIYHTNAGSVIYDYYLDGSSVPLSVADLSQMEQLAQATAVVLQEPETYALDSVPYYFHYDKPVLYDVKALFEHNLPEADYLEWVKALDKAILYKRFSPYWMTIYSNLLRNMIYFRFNEQNFGGLTMFVERQDYKSGVDYDYNEGITHTAWYNAVGWKRFKGDN